MGKSLIRNPLGLGLWLVLIVPGPVYAADGVLEINQACAANSGCFPGDGAGFPVRISASGSYVLTSNLTLSSANDTAINIVSDYVTVDLNGFEIAGVNVCSGGPPPTCSPNGAGSGISSNNDGILVRNGTIRGMGDHGIFLGNTNFRARVENMRVTGNRRGMQVNGAVINSLVVFHEEWGVLSAREVRDCTVEDNGGTGIAVTTGEACLVSGNLVQRNGGDAGIFITGAGSRCVVRDNIVKENAAFGITAGQRSVVLANTITGHPSFGLSITFGGYGQNVIRDNNGGNANPQVTGDGLEIGTNVCGNDTTCP